MASVLQVCLVFSMFVDVTLAVCTAGNFFLVSHSRCLHCCITYELFAVGSVSTGFATKFRVLRVRTCMMSLSWTIPLDTGHRLVHRSWRTSRHTLPSRTGNRIVAERRRIDTAFLAHQSFPGRCLALEKSTPISKKDPFLQRAPQDMPKKTKPAGFQAEEMMATS